MISGGRRRHRNQRRADWHDGLRHSDDEQLDAGCLDEAGLPCCAVRQRQRRRLGRDEDGDVGDVRPVPGAGETGGEQLRAGDLQTGSDVGAGSRRRNNFPAFNPLRIKENCSECVGFYLNLKAIFSRIRFLLLSLLTAFYPLRLSTRNLYPRFLMITFARWMIEM